MSMLPLQGVFSATCLQRYARTAGPLRFLSRSDKKITSARRPGLPSTWTRRNGPLVFQHACKLGLERIVSKRKDSRYGALAGLDHEQETGRAGRSEHPACASFSVSGTRTDHRTDSS